MKITVELDLTDAQVAVCRKWASVSRTLNMARSLIEDITPNNEMHEENVDNCASELGDIEPMLNTIHMQVRTAIWQLEYKKKPGEA